MSAEDLAKGIQALEDDEVLAAVAAGDLSIFAELELTDEEIGLLGGVATESLEVVGFDFRGGLLNLGIGMPAAISPLDQTSVNTTIQNNTQNKAQAASKATAAVDKFIAS